MPALSLIPVLSLMAHASRQPAAPLRILLRTTGYRLRPPHAVPHEAIIRTRQDLQTAAPHRRADIRVEQRSGPLPTVVVGGFVPDATEAFYLLRGGLLRHGSVYYCNYPRRGFATDLFLAQLEDLLEEIRMVHGRRPALIAVSFGAGLVLEMLRRHAAAGTAVSLAGLTLISPVACAEDLLDPAAPKPTTLLGRVLLPYLRSDGTPDEQVVEKSRTVFLRMFESGAQNKDALRFLLTREETRRLRGAVLEAINAIDATGASERVGALRAMPALDRPRALFRGPTLLLHAEKEGAVLQANSPTWRELRERTAAWFPQGRHLVVANTAENPVQHASLIFHGHNFEPALNAFYRGIRQALPRRHAA